jgi:ATP-dependent RNA helicase DHX57
MIKKGLLVSRCLDSALTIAACLSNRSPFVSPFKEREAANKAREKFITAASDQVERGLLIM